MLDDDLIEDNVIVDAETGCWEWQGYCNPDGYGQRKIKGITLRMHRVSYTVYRGDIPEGMCVCHSCDNPACANPEHLFLGTPSDNMQDMWDKGRHPVPKKGVGAKLTKEQVEEIREQKGKISGNALSKQYAVTGGSIRNIWNRVTWDSINENS